MRAKYCFGRRRGLGIVERRTEICLTGFGGCRNERTLLFGSGILISNEGDWIGGKREREERDRSSD